jgi:hypothetical protein
MERTTNAITNLPSNGLNQPVPEQTICGGLLKRRLHWGLSLSGWLLAAGLLGAVFALAVWNVHPFLAVNHPVNCDDLVVEGWIPEYALQEIAELCKTHPYRRILTVGGPVSGSDSPAADDDTHAYVGASRLKKLGIDPQLVEMVPNTVRHRDRTYGSALALRKWLSGKGTLPAAMTVVTLGPHARRSRLLYEKAFGGGASIGILAIENREYDPHHWWRYSEGVKEVVSESAAYLYARFIF